MTIPRNGLTPDIRQLENGLTAIALPRRGAPIGTFWIWYRVGGRNEVSGITGISHWVEHMLFKGTEQIGKGEIFRQVSANGGSLNGFTWIDYTAYFETLPVDRIDLALRIESDRMVNARFDPAEVDSERTVILAEKQGSDNQPNTLLREEVSAASFSAHPYGHGVIGHASDLQAITRDDLFTYYRRYYTPGNAVVVFAGDLSADDAHDRIGQMFGGIPAGNEVPPVRTVEPRHYGERRVNVHRPAPNRVIQVAYAAPQASHPDAAALIVADALLSGGKAPGSGGGAPMGRSSRLYRRLVASGMVAMAGSSFSQTIDPYLFGLSATLKPDSDPDAIEQVLHDEIERLSREPAPAGELERVHKQIRAQHAYATESVVGAASLLGARAMVAPGTRTEEFIASINAVTAEDVMQAAATWLTEHQRVVGWLHPDGPSDATGGASGVHAVPAFYTPDADDLALDTSMPAVRETALPNGLRVVTLEPNPVSTSQAVSIRLRISGGSAMEGEAHGALSFAAAMLTRGSAGGSLEQLAEELDGLGASLTAAATREYIDVAGKALREDADELLRLLTDAVLRPDFPDDQIEIVRGQTLTGIRQARQDTRAEAERGLREHLYPTGHPYRGRVSGDEADVAAIDRQMLQTYHRAAFGARGAIISVAGGLDHDAVVALVGRHLGAWDGSVTQVEIPDVQNTTTAGRFDVGIPGKVQADIAAGVPGIDRHDADYHAFATANLIFGRFGLMGRLGESIRERQGMAYYAYSTLETGTGRGIWSARAGVDPANVGRTIESLREELELFIERGPTEAELADAIGNLTGGLPLGLETSDSAARVALDITFQHLGADYLQRHRGIIRALNAEQLRDVFARRIDPAGLVVVVAGPPKEPVA